MADKIVYRELNTIEKELGFSARALYSVSNNLHEHYREVKILKNSGSSKNSGGFRTLNVPDKFLKAIQSSINRNILSREEASFYAKAYRPGTAIIHNAAPHVNKKYILKLDIQDFFGSIMYSQVKDMVFPADRYDEKIRILLAMLCYYDDKLPQGAPTSPAISNIILKAFDETVGTWCEERKIEYTRYCDDMTFSGDFAQDDVVDFVRGELRKLGFFLKEEKTVFASNTQRQSVTGLTVNTKPAVAKEYKKQIRQEMYYCMKRGIKNHLEHIHSDMNPQTYRRSLLGRVNYILSIEPGNEEIRKYKDWLARKLQPL